LLAFLDAFIQKSDPGIHTNTYYLPWPTTIGTWPDTVLQRKKKKKNAKFSE